MGKNNFVSINLWFGYSYFSYISQYNTLSIKCTWEFCPSIPLELIDNSQIPSYLKNISCLKIVYGHKELKIFVINPVYVPGHELCWSVLRSVEKIGPDQLVRPVKLRTRPQTDLVLSKDQYEIEPVKLDQKQVEPTSRPFHLNRFLKFFSF